MQSWTVYIAHLRARVHGKIEMALAESRRKAIASSMSWNLREVGHSVEIEALAGLTLKPRVSHSHLAGHAKGFDCFYVDSNFYCITLRVSRFIVTVNHDLYDCYKINLNGSFICIKLKDTLVKLLAWQGHYEGREKRSFITMKLI